MHLQCIRNSRLSLRLKQHASVTCEKIVKMLAFCWACRYTTLSITLMEGVHIMVILYKSNSGYTQQYAKLLGKQLDMPVYNIDSAPECHIGSDVIFLGWLMAGGIVGYKKAKRKYKIKCVCGVGMSPPMTEMVEGFRKKLSIPKGTAVFYLQGGFDIKKLKGPFKLIMKLKSKEIAERLQSKLELSEQEQATLNMTQVGDSCVSEKNLAEVISWYKQTN